MRRTVRYEIRFSNYQPRRTKTKGVFKPRLFIFLSFVGILCFCNVPETRYVLIAHSEILISSFYIISVLRAKYHRHNSLIAEFTLI